MSGGDLDGDQYLVIWDEELIKNYSSKLRRTPPANYKHELETNQIKPNQKHQEKTDWKSYVAFWENTTLADIDSCFYELAEQFGVNSKECEELGQIFSRAVDNIPSDVKRLREIISSCSRPSKCSSPSRHTNGKPIWDKLIIKGLELLETLKENNRFPDFNDCKVFCKSLVYCDKSDLERVLFSPLIQGALGGSKTIQLKNDWSIILKERPVNLQIEDDAAECSLDCTDVDCKNKHSTNPQMYKARWMERLNEELSPFTQNIRSKRRKIEKELNIFDHLSSGNEQQKRKCSNDLSVKVQKHNKLWKAYRDDMESKYTYMQNVLSEMSNLQHQYNQRPYWDKDESLLGIIHERKEALIKLFNQMALNINESVFMTNQNISELISNDFNRILGERYKEWKADCPKKELSQTNVESIDQLVIVTLNQMEPLKGKLRKTENVLNETNNKIALKEARKMKLRKEYETQKMLLVGSNGSDGDQHYVSLAVAQKERILSKDIKELKETKTKLDEEMQKMNYQIRKQSKVIEDLKRKRNTVYDKEKHIAKIKEYNKLTDEEIQGQLAGFELAISAFKNEINNAFNFGEETQQFTDSKFRIRTIKALHLSFRRELNRCKRDLTDHNLPVFRKRGDILESLCQHDAVIVVAHTGSGKSTQVPQYLADDLHHVLSIDANKFATVACTQPRRVACIRIAERVSLEYAGAVPIPGTKSGKVNQKKIVYGDMCIAAYPLYAKLADTDQDRALDTEDRVGYDQPAPEKLHQNRSDGDPTNERSEVPNELSGTQGVVGGWVGYQIGSAGKTGDEMKNCKKVSGDTRIHFVTEGLLLQKLKGARESNYNCIIIDEAHERGRDTDLLLAHLRDIVKKNSREENKERNLKVVVMSASINAKQFSRYFNDCPIVNCDGKMHEVTCEYLPPLMPKKENDNNVNWNGYHSREDSDEDSSWEDENVRDRQQSTIKVNPNNKPMKSQDAMKILIQHIVDIIFNKIITTTNGQNSNKMRDGDILVFLPGQGEIHQCVDAINKRARKIGVKKGGCVTRKVVCCTNIAETSLTIPGVTVVLDAGKAKKIQYDNILRISALKLTDISQASAKQRKGRAGRVEPGHCFRLYSEDHFNNEMAPFDIPAMKQSPIDKLYLYAMEVFKGLEEIELMEDAQPDKVSIDSAKKRLWNLEYIESSSSGSIQISTEGKFASSLDGDVSLEGAKMILDAKDSNEGMICDAIKLAVLLEENIYTDKSTNEERAKYTHELGDHLTIFNLYMHFEKMMGKTTTREIEATQEWCEQLGLNFGTLDQMTKRFDRVYKNIKEIKLCNIGSLVQDEIKKENTIKHNRSKNNHGRKIKKKLLEEYDHVKKPTNLMKLVVAGYFHNICMYNDAEFIKAGYSLLTPTNYGAVEYKDPSKDATFLKLRLSQDSNMKEHGDFIKSTATIFHTLFAPPHSEDVFMQISSRIKPEWVKECASKRWANSINLNIKGDRIWSFVKAYSIRNIGVAVMNAIKEETIKIKEEKSVKLIDHLKKESHVKIQMFYETAQIRIYGSTKEISAVLPDKDFENQLIEDFRGVVNRCKIKVLDNDIKVKYPKDKDKKEICKIESGLLIKGEPVIPHAIVSKNLDELCPPVLVITDKNESLTEEAINMMLHGLNQELSPSLQESWKKPDIIFVNPDKTLAKVKFHRLEMAKEYEKLLSNENIKTRFFQNNTSCFMDKEIELRVVKIELYPSISQYVEQEFDSLVCRESKNTFRISVKDPKKNKDQAEKDMQKLMEKLRIAQVKEYYFKLFFTEYPEAKSSQKEEIKSRNILK